jgi:phage gpG-like protein
MVSLLAATSVIAGVLKSENQKYSLPKQPNLKPSPYGRQGSKMTYCNGSDASLATDFFNMECLVR